MAFTQRVSLDKAKMLPSIAKKCTLHYKGGRQILWMICTATIRKEDTLALAMLLGK
jgi:hypothetical protein